MGGKADEISGFKAVDDYTVEITLKSPDLSFLNALTMEFCDVVPQEWVEKWGKQINRHPLGTGRFMFDHWTPGQEIVLKKNPNYWEEGKPYLDEIKYALSFNPSTALLKLQQGEVDALGDGIPPSDIVRDPERPPVEGLRLHPAADRHQLPLPQRRDAAVRRPEGPRSDRLGGRPRQPRQAPGRVRRSPCTSSIRRACRATSRARSTTATTPRRPSRSLPRPATPTASRRCSTPTTSTRTRSSCSRCRPT